VSIVLGLIGTAGAVVLTIAVTALLDEVLVLAIAPTLFLAIVGALGAAMAVRERHRLDHLAVIAAPGAARQKARATRAGRTIVLSPRTARSEEFSARLEGPMSVRREVDSDGRDVEVFGILDEGELVIVRVGEGFLYSRKPLRKLRTKTVS
jgi:hypothetical protein